MRGLLSSRRLTQLAGCAALTLGLGAAPLAELTGAPTALAQVRGVLPVVNRHAALSWGFNAYGQLGDGTKTDRSLYGEVSGLGTGVVQVSAGFDFGLAVTSAGTVRSWGNNTFGALGDGTLVTRTRPVSVSGLSNVTQVAAGLSHSLALRSDGTVWAWGNNQYGEVGNGATSTAQRTPVRVHGLTGVTKIAAGALFSLALRSDGTVWAWGYNGDGQLGNGTRVKSLVPVQVAGLSRVTSIAAGADAGYAIRTTSTGVTSAWAWGGNTVSDLGDGTATRHLTPEKVTGISAPGIAGIAAGAYFALALGTDGSIWGWGSDAGGQLGTSPVAGPIVRPMETFLPGTGITHLSASINITLGGPKYEFVLALKSDGTVLAWGDNSYGQLGVGDTAYHLGPVQVVGLTGASQVSAGNASSLAVYLPPSFGQ